MENLTLYTQPGCGKCLVVEKKLTAKSIPFTKCQDIETMQKLNMTATPAIKIGDKLISNFVEINKFIEEYK